MTHKAINPRQIESARKRSDKKVITDNEHIAECYECGFQGHIITYYDTLANDRTCINCGHTS